MNSQGVLFAKSVGTKAITVVVNIIVAGMSLFCLFPVFWMLYSSLKTQAEFALSIISLPSELRLQNFFEAARVSQMAVNIPNSLTVSVLTVALVLIIGYITGIFLARFDFPQKRLLQLMFLSGMLIPVHALLVPVFIQMSLLNLKDNLFGLSLLYTAHGLPLTVFLVASYAGSIPKELEEAAIVDGANLNVVLLRVLLPICMPVMVTVLILTFLNAWNEFPFALVLLGNANRTVPIGLTFFSGMYRTDYTLMLAGLSIATLPVMIVYFTCYKRIIDGMVAGAIKG